jgi:ATP-dependent DNA ligase
VRRFATLHRALEETPRASDREALLVAYFRSVPAVDEPSALRLLGGPRPRRAVKPEQLRAWAAEAAALPPWLVEESQRAVGDLAETAAHLLESAAGSHEWPLHHLVEERLPRLAAATGDEKRALLMAAWRELPADQHRLWNRLVLATFRPLVSASEVERALAAARGDLPSPRAAPTDPEPESPPPHTVEAVLVYAQRGEGEASTHYVDYTFALWHEGELVPVAKLSGGLPLAEIEELDRWVRRNILERFGPVRRVRPELVFELGFDGVEASGRRKAGLTLRAPRVLRWLRERDAAHAASLQTLRGLGDR